MPGRVALYSPGKATQGRFVESVNGRMRDETQFFTVRQARSIVARSVDD